MTMFINRAVCGIICVWINSDPYKPNDLYYDNVYKSCGSWYYMYMDQF